MQKAMLNFIGNGAETALQEALIALLGSCPHWGCPPGKAFLSVAKPSTIIAPLSRIREQTQQDSGNDGTTEILGSQTIGR